MDIAGIFSFLANDVHTVIMATADGNCLSVCPVGAVIRA